MKASKIIKSIVSVVLSTAISASCALTVFAGSTTGGSGGTDTGSGSVNWQVNPNATDVIAIRLSCITDNSTIGNMATPDYRYGNGSSSPFVSTLQYPLYMLAGGSDTHASDNSVISGKTVTQIKSIMESEYTNFKNITKCKYEYYCDGNSYGYVKPDAGEEPYLENILHRAKTSSTITETQLKDLWYFYTRMAQGANADKQHNESGSNLGSKLQSVIVDNVLETESRTKSFQRGYLVALSLAYPSAAIVSSIDSNSDELWDSGFTTLVVDKEAMIKNTNNRFQIGSYTDNLLISVSSFCDIVRRLDSRIDKNTTNPYKEYYAINKISGYSGNNKPISLWWSTFRGMYGDITPGYTYSKGGKRAGNDVVDSNGKRVFAGWGYYEITNGSTQLDPYRPVKDDQENIATEVVYNAYISSDGVLTARNTFGNNGHVMTDVVYLSGVVDKEDVINEYSNQTDFVNNNGYLKTTVDKTINLSTPTEGTDYKLHSVYYNIANANGRNSTYVIDSDGSTSLSPYVLDEVTEDSDSVTSNNTISVKGKDLKDAFGNKEARYYIRKQQKITSAAIRAGYYTKNGSNVNYNLYTYNGSQYKIVKDSNGNNVTTKVDSDFVKNLNTDDNTIKIVNKNSAATVNKTVDIDDIKKDFTEKSTNFYYFKDDNNDYNPIIFKNGSWYSCPVEYVTNLLVVIRANYVADFGVGSDNYKNTYESAKMPEYLLSKNYSTDDFTKKELYTMIDNYVTNQEGTLVNRTNKYASNTQNNIDLFAQDSVKEYDPYNYSYTAALASSNGDLYFSLYDTGNYDEEGGWTDSSAQKDWDPDYYSVGSANSLSGNVRKYTYVKQIIKSAPSFGEPEDTGLSFTTIDKTLPNTLYYYEDIDATDEKYPEDSPSTDTKDIKQVALAYTQRISNNNKSNIKSITVNTNNWNGTFGYLAEQKVSMILRGGEIAPEHKVDLTSMCYSGSSMSSSEVAGYKNGYRESYFTKLLAKYRSTLYEIRGTIAKEATPNIASWKYDSNTGLINTYNVDLKNVGKTINSLSTDKNNGYVRFGQSFVFAEDLSVDSDDNLQKITYRTTNQSEEETPASLSRVSFTTNIKKSILNTSTTRNRSFDAVMAAFTQSSVDVPLDFTIKSHDTKDRDKQEVDTTISSSGKSVFQTYQYEETKPWTGIFKTSGSNKVSLGVYPEVLMFAENDRTSGSSLTYSSVITVGAKERYIPAMTYAKANFNDLSIKAQVTGTAVAFDTRAKALAKSLGSKDVQVLYSGSGLKMAFKTNAAGTVKSYALDFNGSVTSSSNNIARGTNGWGNGNYYTINAATAATKNLVNELSATSKKELAVYNSDKNTLTQIPVGSESTLSLSASAPTYTNTYYNLVIRNGQITSVQEKLKDGDTYSVVSNYKVSGSNVTSSDGGNTEKLKEILEGMRLIGSDSVLPASFENGTGESPLPDNSAFGDWISNNNATYNNRYTKGGKSYYEDCTTLQIKEYTANITAGKNSSTATEQLPLNIGPSTPSDKNQYFSNGYKGFVNATLEIKYDSNVIASASTEKKKIGGGTVVVKDADTAKNAIPDFIIGDVTINEATGY